MPKWFTELMRPAVVSYQGGVSRTEKSHRVKCNINTIVNKYRKTGLCPQRGTPGFYGDFSNVPDYQTCIEQVNIAQDAFMSLPSKVRKEFDNDPAKLLKFLDNPDNRDKAIELGILPPPPAVEEPIVPPEPA